MHPVAAELGRSGDWIQAARVESWRPSDQVDGRNTLVSWRAYRNRSNEDGLLECMVLAINDGLQHGAVRTGNGMSAD